MDQIDVAVELGFQSHAAVSHVERGRSSIHVDRVASAAKLLRVSADYLLGLTNDPTPADQRPGLVPNLTGADWLIAPPTRGMWARRRA